MRNVRLKMGMGVVAMMDYTITDVINQYSLLAVPITIVILTALVSRWVIRR